MRGERIVALRELAMDDSSASDNAGAFTSRRLHGPIRDHRKFQTAATRPVNAGNQHSSDRLHAAKTAAAWATRLSPCVRGRARSTPLDQSSKTFSPARSMLDEWCAFRAAAAIGVQGTH